MTSVYCGCGANWHGKWVTKAAGNIAAHQARWASRKLGCFSMTHAEFIRKYRCGCAECDLARAEERVQRARERAEWRFPRGFQSPNVARSD